MEPHNTPDECDHDSTVGEEYVTGRWVDLCSRCCPCPDCGLIRDDEVDKAGEGRLV